MFNLDIRNSGGLFPGAQRVLAVIDDFEPRHTGGREAVDQSRQRTVAFSAKLSRFSIAQQAGLATHCPVAALGFESLKFPRFGALYIFLKEHRLQLRRAHLAAEPV